MLKQKEQAELWRELSRAGIISAKYLFQLGDFRGSVNRAYYAAYHAGTAVTVSHGNDFARGWGNPTHDQLPDLIRNNGDLPVAVRKQVSQLLRSLRVQRENADYRPGLTVDRQEAQNCLHRAEAVLDLLEANDG